METTPSSPIPADDPAAAKVGRAYWDANWSTLDLPPAVDPDGLSFRNHANRALAGYLACRLGDGAGLRLLEIGCARSAWLPYFRRRLGYSVTGLDYSPVGCEQARAVLQRDAVDGEVVCADLFAPPPALSQAFDAIVSFGVFEHFDDVGEALSAAVALLAPGGRICTVIPNMRGLPGLMQRALDRAIYDIHNPLTPADLAAAHAAAGLAIEDARYLLTFHSGVGNTGRPDAVRSLLARKLGGLVTLAAWLSHGNDRPAWANGVTSPYVVCTAFRPAAG